MLQKNPYINKIKIDTTSSKFDEKSLKNVSDIVKFEYKVFIIKAISAFVFIGVGIFLISKDIQYADAQVNFKMPGVEINCYRVIPGVLCLIFAFILLLYARINVTVKQSKS
jgi:hypothetical protein